MGDARQPVARIDLDKFSQPCLSQRQTTRGVEWSPHEGYVLAPADLSRAGFSPIVGRLEKSENVAVNLRWMIAE